MRKEQTELFPTNAEPAPDVLCEDVPACGFRIHQPLDALSVLLEEMDIKPPSLWSRWKVKQYSKT